MDRMSTNRMLSKINATKNNPWISRTSYFYVDWITKDRRKPTVTVMFSRAGLRNLIIILLVLTSVCSLPTPDHVRALVRMEKVKSATKAKRLSFHVTATGANSRKFKFAVALGSYLLAVPSTRIFSGYPVTFTCTSKVHSDWGNQPSWRGKKLTSKTVVICSKTNRNAMGKWDESKK